MILILLVLLIGFYFGRRSREIDDWRNLYKSVL
jgi:hypothetical protein